MATVDETSKEVIVKVNEIEEAVSLYKDKEPIIEEKTDVAKSQKVAKLAAKTGDNAKLGLLILLAGISLVVITLNLKKKRKVQ
ncbi:MAG: sortase B protein-sorting domain-containing protein [Clostridium sp.]|nr:sortase B protein-sorting domain-containing protein [Clostridium sp.]